MSVSAFDRLRQARNAEEIAREIEPLAQALAALSDELRQTLEDLRTATNSATDTLETGNGKLITSTNNATTQADKIKTLFGSLLEGQKKAARTFTLTMWGLAILTSLVGGAGAGIGLWIWRQPSRLTEEQAERWLEIVTTHNKLDPAKKKQFNELMGWSDPKPKPKTERLKP